MNKIIVKHSDGFDLENFFPQEELLTLKQLYYLILILAIYFCIMNFFINRLYHPSVEMILISSIVDIILSMYITVTFFDGSTKRRILSLFLMPLASISYLLFGGSIIGYWDFIRIPALLYLVVHYYNKFLAHTHKNNLDKLILVLVSVIYFSALFTLVAEDPNPINSLAMVSNAFTSNSYFASGKTSTAVLVSALVGWSGYIISGVATASLAAAITFRRLNNKFEEIGAKQDNFEKIITEYKENENGSEIKELKDELKSIHDENAELKREIVELKDLIKNK